MSYWMFQTLPLSHGSKSRSTDNSWYSPNNSCQFFSIIYYSKWNLEEKICAQITHKSICILFSKPKYEPHKYCLWDPTDSQQGDSNNEQPNPTYILM